MKRVNGFVFIADLDNEWPMFGKKGRHTDGSYGNIQTNNLTPYNNLEETIDSGKEFLKKRKNCKKITPAKIQLKIAETEKEAEDKFKDETNLIVIATLKEENYIEQRLFGPIIKGKPTYGVIPAAFLSDTNYTTFNRNQLRELTPYQRAVYSAQQICRQAQTPCRIAKLKLERFKDIYKR